MYPMYRASLSLPERLENPSGAGIQQCDLDQDTPALREIFDCFNGTRTGTIVRSVEYWNNRPIWREYEPSLFWTARQNGVIVAYLMCDRWFVREMGYLPNHESATVELFHRFLIQARVEGVNSVEAIVPNECRRLLAATGCKVRRVESYHTMIRIINLESLFRKMLPTFETRLNESDDLRWGGLILIRCESDNLTLSVDGGKIELSADCREPKIDLAVSQTQLLNLLFGNMTAEQIAFSNGLAINDGEMEKLGVLFPPGELFLWEHDRF